MEQISTDVENGAKRTSSLVGAAAGVVGGAIVCAWAVGMLNHFLGGLSVWTMLVAIPVALTIGFSFGYTVYRTWLFPFSFYVDSVIDCGDHLLIENDGVRKKIRFDEIAEVSYSYLSPIRIVITPKLCRDIHEPIKFRQESINFRPRNVSDISRLANSLRERIIESEL